MHTRILPTLVATSALLIVGASVYAPAQTPATIQVLKQDLNGDFMPDNTTTQYQVHGRITSPDLQYFDSDEDTTYTEIYIQDPSDNYGIQVLFNDPGFDPSPFTIGKEARVNFAFVRQTNGVTNVRPFFDLGSIHFTITDPTVLPITPVTATISSLLADAERWEGTLVTVSNITSLTGNWPAFGGSESMTMSDGTGTLTLRVDQDTSVSGQYEPNPPFNLTGIFTQYDPAAPFDAGYQIIPRFYGDFDQGLPPAPPAIQLIPEGPLSVAANQSVSFDALGLDSNESDTLVFAAPGAPAGSTLQDTRDRLARFTYTPTVPGSTDYINITVNDGGTTVTQTMEVIVLSEELANIVLNEVLYDPPSGLPGDANRDGVRSSTNDEFVELLNDNSTDVDIGGWVLRHNQTTDVFTFPSGTILTGKSAAVVFGGGTPTGLFGNAQVFTANNWVGLNEDYPGGATLSLHTDTDLQVFAVAYGTLPSYGGYFTDASLTRDPDFTGDFARHTFINPDRLFSPGTLNSGAAFPGSGLANVPPDLDPILDVSARIGQELVIPIRALDGDGDAISLEASGEPATANLIDNGDGTGSLVYAGLLADAGLTFPITVTAADASSTASVSFVLSVVSAQYSGLVINEILADPDAQNGAIQLDTNEDGVFNLNDDEFIEIVNNTAAPLDLAGCMLSDNASIRHVFTSVVLPTGGVVVVFGGGSGSSFVAAPAQVASAGSLSLVNGGDTVSLYDPDTNLLDRFSYSEQLSAISWTRFPDITGAFTNHLDVTAQTRRASPGRTVTDQPFLADQPPNLAPIDDVFTAVGGTIEFLVEASDEDGHAITLSVSNLPAWASFSPVTAPGYASSTFSGTPTATETTTVTFCATDINGTTCRDMTIVVSESRTDFWDFENGLQGFTEYSRDSTTSWERDDNFDFGAGAETSAWYMVMDGYQGGTASDDWLISPRLDLTPYGEPAISYYRRWHYNGPMLKLWVSTDYSGAGDPLAPGVTWDDLGLTDLAADTWEQEVKSLAAYAGSTNAYIAFQYLSDGPNGNGESREWRLDQIRLGEAPANEPPVIMAPTEDQQVFVGNTLMLEVLTTEVDGDPVTITTDGAPANSTFTDNTDGTADYSFTPDPSQVGTQVVAFVAGDKDGAVTNTIRILVLEPVAGDTLWDFEDAISPWFTYSRASNEDWERSDQFTASQGTDFYMVISGYGADVISDDWLISPKIDLTAFADPKLVYDLFFLYGNTPGELALKASTDYTGSGDPAGATWQDLGLAKPASGSAWTSTTNSLTAFTGSNSVYLAFQYVNGLGTGDAEIWQVDQIELLETPLDEPPVITPVLVDRVTSVGHTLLFDITTVEPDGDVITITDLPSLDNSVLTHPANGQATYSFTPTAGQLGDHVVSFVASDPDGADTNTITITVLPEPVAGDPWINEIHYDNTGGDVGEFVEIAGPAGHDLGRYTIVKYNGNGAASYGTNALSGAIDLETDCFGAVAFAIEGLQNGGDDPDGIALVRDGTSVIEFISYEGSMTAADGPAAGMTSIDIGVAEPGAVGESLQLVGAGIRSTDFTWSGPTNESPGSLNADQVIVGGCGGGETDTDGDGATDAEEAIAGTDPGNPDDVFIAADISVSGGDLSVVLPTKVSRNYVIEYTDDLADTNSWQELMPAQGGSGGDETFMDLSPTNRVLFYRGDVRLP